jgi:hypothetical protein
MGIVAGCTESNKPESKTVTVEGANVSNNNRQIFIIKDYRQNLQWDAICFDRSLIIIPNTQKPINAEKE